MKNLMIASAVGVVLSSSLACAAPAGSPQTVPTTGTTTEVRYISTPPGTKGAPVSKIVIIRDANGRIISVKRA